MSVTPALVSESTGEMKRALDSSLDADWNRLAGDLDWSCRQTGEHVADDLFSYASQVLAQPVDDYLPIEVTVPDEAPPADLVRSIVMCGELLRLAVASASKGARAWHPYGTSDPEGFVAMGIVEVLVHTHDIARGLDIDWAPPEELCRPVLLRLFPDAAQGHPSEVLLWCTGRRHSATAHVSRLGAGTLPSADRQEPGTPASAADGVRHRLHPVQLRPAARTDRPKSDCQRRRSLAAYEG